eukprot:scaffold1547_cov112-Cylindrotheca_fusiformis.AAC.1
MILQAYRCGNLKAFLKAATKSDKKISPSSLLPPVQRVVYCNHGIRSFSSNNSEGNEHDKISSSSPSSSGIWQQLKSPPNLITLARLASTPLLAYWIISEQHTLAIWGCAAAGLSDAVDGWLFWLLSLFLSDGYEFCRPHLGKYIGTYLDPVSDKVVINGLADVALLTGTAVLLYKNYSSINIFTASIAEKPLKVEPTNIAKANTALQFATLGVAIVSPVGSLPPMLLEGLCWTTGATTIASVLSYTTKSAITSIATEDDDKK